ncbi:5'-methylthioadenosine/S-adenosylhomocysteine nucleosidase family protein [Amycolatopsis samaneae]|uniref:5'-methylthioadenosine/S-adenosylhomocysteine nucleosidase n=1 Tax=Amycolatopsis samaneae TaxID=664691 RepID=A0ABW5GWM2_9PSEU
MIVVLTALEVEHAAVRAHLTDVERHRHRAGTIFDVGTLSARPGRRVALAATGMGNITAAALTERAIAEFDPSMMLFVGVAGGLRDWLRLGDVVVATRVYGYHGGRSEDDEFLTRPRAWETSHRAEQTARWLARSADWFQQPPSAEPARAPMVHFEPVAAGDVVLNSRVSDLAHQLHRSYNDAVAIEMESAGFAAAGHLNDRVPSITVRGISDLAGGAKDQTDGEGWQQVAARNAAAFAVAVAADLEEDEREPPERGEPSGVHVRNHFSGKARSVIQTGVHHGDINIG